MAAQDKARHQQEMAQYNSWKKRREEEQQRSQLAALLEPTPLAEGVHDRAEGASSSMTYHGTISKESTRWSAFQEEEIPRQQQQEQLDRRLIQQDSIQESLLGEGFQWQQEQQQQQQQQLHGHLQGSHFFSTPFMMHYGASSPSRTKSNLVTFLTLRTEFLPQEQQDYTLSSACEVEWYA